MEDPKIWRLFGSLLGLNSDLLTHSGLDDDVDVLVLIFEHADKTLTNFTFGDLDIVLGVTVILQQGEEVIVGDIQKLVLLTGNVGDVHVVGGGGQILKLLASEDIDGDQVNLGVTVLASLGGGHVNDLARAVLDDDVTVLTQSRALHGVGGRGTGISRVEGNVVLVSHYERVGV